VIVLVIGDRRHKLPLGADDRERLVLPPAKQRRRRCANNVKKIDARIAYFRELATYVMDRTRLDSIEVVIAKLEADKKVLHPKT